MRTCDLAIPPLRRLLKDPHTKDYLPFVQRKALEYNITPRLNDLSRPIIRVMHSSPKGQYENQSRLNKSKSNRSKSRHNFTHRKTNEKEPSRNTKKLNENTDRENTLRNRRSVTRRPANG